MKSVPAIAFDIRPSRKATVAIGATTLLSTLAIVLSGIDPILELAFATLAVAYGGYSIKRFLSSQPRRAVWHPQGHWRIADTDGEEHVAELQSATVRGNWIVLNLRSRSGKQSLILAPDNCDVDLHRRLRVRLARTREEPKI